MSALIGSLLGSLGSDKGSIQDIIQNLGSCDVRVQGMCCYFPQFCDPIAKCVSATPNSLGELANSFPKCVCPEGYTGDGRVKGSGCRNVDECATGLAQCAHLCVDLIPGWRCECRLGYRLESDGRSCRDVDECLERKHDCSHLCKNTPGSFKCLCPAGFRMQEDGRTCSDVDECAQGLNQCPFPELCINTVGGYECGCPRGFVPRGSECEDVNECLSLGSRACPNSLEDNTHTQLCENVVGTHVCQCLAGLEPKGPQVALPEDLTDVNNVSLEWLGARYDAAAEYREQLACQDVDECANALHDCPSHTQCRNTYRGYECECETEGHLYNAHMRVCAPPSPQAPELASNAKCSDECHAPCLLTSNGYYCGCPKGFVAPVHHDASWDQLLTNAIQEGVSSEEEFTLFVSAHVQCEDIDECTIPGLHVCGIGCTCVNLPGGFECKCPDGKRLVSESLDSDYDLMLDVNEHFIDNTALYSEDEIIRIINHNGPRHAVIAWASVPVDRRHRWMIDQIDWRLSEYIELPENFEKRLAVLKTLAEALVPRFLDLSVEAIDKGSMAACIKKLCVCPSQNKPCCAFTDSGQQQCSAARTSFLLRKQHTCPPGSVYAFSQRLDGH